MPFNSFNFWLIFPFIFGVCYLIPAISPMHLKDCARLKMNEKYVVFDVKCTLDRKIVDGRL